ncbi:hypothetical protein BHS07_21985 [Myxococcus xanthus]|nr:hypothetical protein BHS07_21985 [Myxococcus xanthus]QDE98161.1 hypothetical protein BHS05_21235 [Myxococcus xanthus]QDF05872.1 hypothetical protein BHS04_22075 [Myxococcus xanthus]
MYPEDAGSFCFGRVDTQSVDGAVRSDSLRCDTIRRIDLHLFGVLLINAFEAFSCIDDIEQILRPFDFDGEYLDIFRCQFAKDTRDLFVCDRSSP